MHILNRVLAGLSKNLDIAYTIRHRGLKLDTHYRLVERRIHSGEGIHRFAEIASKTTFYVCVTASLVYFDVECPEDGVYIYNRAQ